MSPRPVLPKGKHTRSALAGLAGLAGLRAVALVLLMAALAHALAQWADGAVPEVVRLSVQGSIGAVLLGTSIWGQQVLARRAALGTKEELRAQLIAFRLGGRNNGSPGRSSESGTGSGTGAEGMLASRGLDGLDNYFTAYLPALVSTAVLPAMVGVQILISDWVSALIVVLTIPLVPVFMILIGFHTQDRVQLAARGLDRLSNHLLELARGLPMLVGLRRARAQRQALADVSEQYRKSTMATLRTAFLSAMALELISTISVALVAVFIGVRLVYGQMPLEAGLLALMLAPECFRPLRDIGAAHHGSEDGVEALRRVNEILGTHNQVSATEDAHSLDDTAVMRAQQLTIRYPGRSEAALENFTATLFRGETLVLGGASGTGKSTALAAMAGIVEEIPSQDHSVGRTGTLITVPSEAIVWVPQHPVFTEETVAQEVALYAAGPGGIIISTKIVASALALVNAEHLSQRSPLDCSPGELRRIAVARALARITTDPSVELALFDEPTAHLDPVSAQYVRTALASLRGKVALVVATHDTVLSGLLRTRTTELTDSERGLTAPPNFETPSEVGSSGAPQVATTQPPTDSHASHSTAFQWHWLKHLPLRSPRFAAGVMVSALATLSAAALSAISGWLIVWAASQPPMMYLMTLIVGVRTFGIARSVLRYSERLLTHDSVFRWAATLRLGLWDALGTDVRHWGKLTRSGGSLGTLIADVDELRDALPRAIVPLPAAVISYFAVLATVWWLMPQGILIVIGLGVLAFLVLPIAVYLAQKKAAAVAALHRSWLADRATTLFAAAEQLAANGVGPAQARRFASRDAEVSVPLRRIAWANGLGQSGVSVMTSLAAVALTAVAIGAGVDPRAAAVVALLMLALAEPLGQFVEAVEQLPVLGAMMARTMTLLDTPHTVVDADGDDDNLASRTANGSTASVTRLRVEGISAHYPESKVPVFVGVSGGTTQGSWWTVSGPSGSGKSTLLAVLLGFLEPSRGSYTLDGLPANSASLRQIAWCPQESYLFNSTLRSNLALARPATDSPDDVELVRALETVGLGPWFRALPDALATRVGPGGQYLSGGQRTRVAVARALVATASVVLLDEPTAHLGEDEADELIAELRTGLRNAAVVLVTHNSKLAAVGQTQLVLGRESAVGPGSTSSEPRVPVALAGRSF